jgi:hypothetical protein
MMAAQLTATTGGFRFGSVLLLFTISCIGTYDVSVHRQKFIIAQDVEGTSTLPLTIVANDCAQL